MFINFLLFHTSIRCLVYYAKSEYHLRFAEIALSRYVDNCETIYSKSFMSYNTHGLLHLVEDVRECEDDLDSFSAFPYENNMMTFRKLCRSPHKPLQQIAKRLAEQTYRADLISCNTLPRYHAYNLRLRNDETGSKHFDTIKTPDLLLSTKSPNNCIKVNNEICIISDIVLRNNEYFLDLCKYRNVGEFYNVGISSLDVGIYLCSNLQTEFDIVIIHDVSKKCFLAPLSHTDINYEVCDFVPVDEQYVAVEM